MKYFIKDLFSKYDQIRKKLQETTDLVTFTEEIFNENFIFCVVWIPMKHNFRKLKVTEFIMLFQFITQYHHRYSHYWGYYPGMCGLTRCPISSSFEMSAHLFPIVTDSADITVRHTSKNELRLLYFIWKEKSELSYVDVYSPHLLKRNLRNSIIITAQ